VIEVFSSLLCNRNSWILWDGSSGSFLSLISGIFLSLFISLFFSNFFLNTISRKDSCGCSVSDLGNNFLLNLGDLCLMCFNVSLSFFNILISNNLSLNFGFFCVLFINFFDLIFLNSDLSFLELFLLDLTLWVVLDGLGEFLDILNILFLFSGISKLCNISLEISSLLLLGKIFFGSGSLRILFGFLNYLFFGYNIHGFLDGLLDGLLDGFLDGFLDGGGLDGFLDDLIILNLKVLII